jgi:hypothetical protein
VPKNTTDVGINPTPVYETFPLVAVRTLVKDIVLLERADVALWNVGSAPAPLLVSTCPDVPTLAIDCTGDVLVLPPHITA